MDCDPLTSVFIGLHLALSYLVLLFCLTKNMPRSADIGSKKLISLSPNTWVQWVTQKTAVTAQGILNSEFQWISRESDVLIRAHSPEEGEFLILNELQLRYTQQMPRRMRAYAALAEERYELPVYPVLVNILAPASTTTVVSCYQSEFMGLKAQQDYHVINLWEIDVNLVFQQPIPSLLPFVPILRGGNQAAMVQQALQILRNDAQLNELEPLLAFFASFVLETQLIQQIMRWDMAVLRESPWYQEILQQGLQQGMQQGIQQGMRQGLLSGIELGLELKFGIEGLRLLAEISEIQSLEKLEQIRDGFKTANTLEEFRQIYLRSQN